MKKAMLILTRECHRSCKNCCNDLPDNQKYWDEATVLGDLSGGLERLQEFDEVRITGGEPLLYEASVGGFLNLLSQRNPEQDLYLYTSLCTPHVKDMATVLRGITFSMHSPVRSEDIYSLAQMQVVSRYFPEVSFRLSIDPEISDSLPIIPTRWSSIRSTPMKEVCPPPSDTEIFVWKGVLR